VDGPGELLARGRDSDIYACGPGLVLRRARDGRRIDAEARIMEAVREQGYPVPAVHEVRADGTELVMDRVEGPTMLAAMSRAPWSVARHARVLGDLHRRLHTLGAPDWLQALPDGGDCVVHLDLHPLNVLYGPSGPMVIDWTNAARGAAETDLAQTWLILAASDVAEFGRFARVGRPFQRGFATLVLRGFDRRSIVPFLRPVADARARDRHVEPSEVASMYRIVDREERRVARRG